MCKYRDIERGFIISLILLFILLLINQKKNIKNKTKINPKLEAIAKV